MNKTLRKCISSMVALSTMGATLGVAAATHAAGQLTLVSNNLSTSVGLTVSNHTLKFSNASTTPFSAVKFQYCTTPSATCVLPSGLSTTSATLGATTGGSGTWVLAASASNGTVLVTNSATTGPLSTIAPFSFDLTSVTNNDSVIAGAGACDTVPNSESCYVRFSTYSDTAATILIDTGSTSYTVITQILVTATVDPVLTFTIAGVLPSAIVTNDSLSGCSGGGLNATSSPTAIPFGNLGVGIGNAICGQQSLTVVTNAQNGYSVYNKFYNSTQASILMYGTNALNKLDPYGFTGTTYAAPTVFSATPTGTTPNSNTGWVGMRTKNTGVGAYSSTSNTYGTPFIGLGAGNTVMTQLTPDSGTVPTYVTFKVAVSAYQPADSYTGAMFYTVVPSY